MTTSTTPPASRVHDLRADTERPRRGHTLVAAGLVLLGVLALAGAGLATRTMLHRPAPSRATSAAQPRPAEDPGGSVYREQVPSAVSPWTMFGPGSAYAPGGSVYNQQVPALARIPAASGQGNQYAPGGSVYSEQVPAAARAVAP